VSPEVFLSRRRTPDGRLVVGYRAWVGCHYLDGYFASARQARAVIAAHGKRLCALCGPAPAKQRSELGGAAVAR
jgi:hypothetical protein